MEAMMIDSMMKGDEFDMTDLMNLDENQLEKFMKAMEGGQEGDWLNEDEEDLTEEEYKILKFG